MAYLLWIVIVGGGFFLGGGALAAQIEGGFQPVLAANALLYLGCALYGLPRFLKLLRGGSR